MKKITTTLFAFCLLMAASGLQAQISFTVSQNQQCYANGNNTVAAAITVSTAGTTNYTWSVSSSTCSATYTFSSGNGSSVNASLPCVGTYTLVTYAMNGSSAITSATQVVTINPVPVITATAIPNNVPTCSGTSYTIVPGGGITYTINGPGFIITPLATGCATIGGTNSFGCNAWTVACYSVIPNPTITIVGPTSNCAGATATLVAAGASTYTWIPGSLVGPSIVVSPTANICYTVIGASPAGCASTAQHCMTIGSSPSLFAIGAPTVICAGNSATLSAGGASTYTWMPGGMNSANVVVTPTTSTNYVLTGSTGPGCTATTNVVVVVNPTPTIAITPSTNNTICPGSSATLVATGGTTYSWSVGATTQSIVVSPLVSTCYSVASSNTNFCTSMAVHCVTVANVPNISFVASSVNGSFVCEGSTITYTANASGALSYSWSGGSTNSTYSMIAGTFANYSNLTQTVTALFANGCISTGTVTPWQQTYTCSNVWPGDANRDGVVSNTDVFELGLANNATGPARTGGSNTWINQFATNWTGTVSTGWNLNHADCNGDGTINAADTVAIVNNFGLTHAFKVSSNSAPDITLLVPANVTAGQWAKADVMLGSSTSPMNQIYGIAFDLGIDQTLLDNNSAYLVYTSSFLNAGNQNIVFRKNDLNNGSIYAASVRVNGSSVSGDGKIAELWFKVSPSAQNNAQLNLSVSNIVKVNNSGTQTSLNGGTSSAVVVSEAVGLNQCSPLSKNLSVYPNPAANQLTLLNSTGTLVNFTIVDVLGREVMSGEFSATKTIDVSSLEQGTFIVQFESAGQTTFKKLVVEKR
jgi:hypothetical protein